MLIRLSIAQLLFLLLFSLPAKQCSSGVSLYMIFYVEVPMSIETLFYISAKNIWGGKSFLGFLYIFGGFLFG